MVESYRRAIAGAAVTVAFVVASQFGVEFPEGTGEALITLIVFGLGFLPSPSSSPPPPSE